MAFTSPEFPGLTFESIEELRAARKTRRELQQALSGKAVITISDIEEEANKWDLSGLDIKE